MEKIIVGCRAGRKAAIEAYLLEKNMHEKVEVVEVEDKPPVIEELKESICMFDAKNTYEPFFQKKKHQPKGHERKYKYHK